MIRAFALAVAMASVVLAACVPSRFYVAPGDEPAGAPGTIIRAVRIEPPPGMEAWRILYRSTGLDGEPIAVSGFVVMPAGFTGQEGQHIVAWAHPTTGVATQCAPTLAPLMFEQLAGMEGLIRQGYAIAATDYPGLGTPGIHPYLVGDSEGRAVLDSVRAARNLIGSTVDDRFALWGHSQGGHAALYATMMAADYAPELSLVGTAVAAPATRLATLVRDDAATGEGRNLAAMSIWAWTRLFDTPVEAVVDADAIPVLNEIAEDCIDTVIGLVERRGPATVIDAGFLSVPDLTAVEPWRTLLDANTPGVTPRGVPVFIAQGTADELVLPPVTESYFRSLCAAGRAATLHLMPGVTHGEAGRRGAPAATEWIAERFAGRPAPNTC
ncbi:MAG: alpha/beta fold hydrolase [Bauldia sp.]